MKSNIVSPSPNTFETAASRLQSGHLVAFPTETVYGLGANALDAQAVDRIFKAKGRPKTDPLIVHVLSERDAESLVNVSARELDVFMVLAKHFWPGPLTLVLNAASTIPKNVTGGGLSVGLRSPAHPVARELLKHAQRPIAAPSANRFGHVSPTTAAHVYDDLGREDVLIIDGGASSVGVESSVVKLSIEDDKIVLEILRPGFVTPSQLSSVLDGEGYSQVVIKQHARVVSSESETQSSPGQLLTHYSPRLECFLWNPAFPFIELKKSIEPRETVLIDFGKRFFEVGSQFLSYIDLSPTGLVDEASRNLFLALRTAEETNGAHCILLPDVSLSDERWAAVYDRMFRAASGKFKR